jgi:hypothetical protein
VPVGGTLVLKGKNFRSGAANNRVFLSRATDGKSVRVRPKKASKTRIELVVPSTVTKFLIGGKATRFQISIFTKVLGPKTKKSRSPIILPAGSTPAPGGGGGSVPGATAADCDADGLPNNVDTDDDNDLLGDAQEAKLGTDPCKADSDGDGIEDGYEYFSALDLNGNAVPYPGARPFPNPLDGTDALKDFDRDGLTDLEEFLAWVKTGNHVLPLNYSAGKLSTDGVANDGNRDADGDGLTNVTELAKAQDALFNPARRPDIDGLMQLDFLNNDTDGDTIGDGADDNDHDGLSNLEEITAGDDGRTTDPEDPRSGSPDCDGDGQPNSVDGDDDNDGLPDATDRGAGLSQCNKDTDGDGVEDGYEYYAARDLNGNANPYPGTRPFPNALDGSDAGKDFDGDGMTSKEEFAAWNLYGGRVLPAASGQSFPYSDGNQTSTAPANAGGNDFDGNSKLTDDEKDADNDGLANWLEMAHGPAGNWTMPNGTPCPTVGNTGPNAGKWPTIYSDCGGGRIPNADTFRQVVGYPWDFTLDYLAPDSDGDGVNDLNDDQDHDGISNLQEITAGSDTFFTDPQDPCDPNPESPSCPQHAG